MRENEELRRLIGESRSASPGSEGRGCLYVVARALVCVKREIAGAAHLLSFAAGRLIFCAKQDPDIVLGGRVSGVRFDFEFDAVAVDQMVPCLAQVASCFIEPTVGGTDGAHARPAAVRGFAAPSRVHIDTSLNF